MGTVSDSEICVSPGPEPGSVTVIQSVLVTVPMCCPEAGVVVEDEFRGGCAGSGSVTVTQSVLVTVPPCCPVVGVVVEGEVGSGCVGVWLSVVGGSGTVVVVKVVCGDDVGTGTGVTSVNSEDADDVGTGTGVISVNS